MEFEVKINHGVTWLISNFHQIISYFILESIAVSLVRDWDFFFLSIEPIYIPCTCSFGIVARFPPKLKQTPCAACHVRFLVILEANTLKHWKQIKHFLQTSKDWNYYMRMLSISSKMYFSAEKEIRARRSDRAQEQKVWIGRLRHTLIPPHCTRCNLGVWYQMNWLWRGQVHNHFSHFRLPSSCSNRGIVWNKENVALADTAAGNYLYCVLSSFWWLWLQLFTLPKGVKYPLAHWPRILKMQ